MIVVHSQVFVVTSLLEDKLKGKKFVIVYIKKQLSIILHSLIALK